MGQKTILCDTAQLLGTVVGSSALQVVKLVFSTFSGNLQCSVIHLKKCNVANSVIQKIGRF